MKKIFFFIFMIVSFYSCAQTVTPSWYRTQDGTGIGNCGPACVAMIINWADRDQNMSVQDVRSIIGYKQADGSTAVEELMYVIKQWKIPSIYASPQTLADLVKFVSQENLIALVVINAAKISKSKGDQYGRNHSYTFYHYVLLTGVQFGKWFIVQDPLGNGANRLYDVNEVWNAIGRAANYSIFVMRP